MKRTDELSIETEIENLGREVAAYREVQGNRHLPEAIWNKAVQLCRRAPINRVATGISVSLQGLRNHVKAVPERKRNKKNTETAFMEVTPAAIKAMAHMPSQPTPVGMGPSPGLPIPFGPSFAPIIELERRDGLKLRLQMPTQGFSASQLLNLFMGGLS